jgi:hypothetical protein
MGKSSPLQPKSSISMYKLALAFNVLYGIYEIGHLHGVGVIILMANIRVREETGS